MSSPGERGEDRSGRDRMAWNVLTSWGSYLLLVAAGFLMPRMIDHYIGQTALGVWDFGWSVVSYFSLAQVGVGSSVNRYVAKHLSTGDVVGLSRSVSSVSLVNLGAAAVVATATAAACWLVPRTFGGRLGEHSASATVMIALLGAAIAIPMALDAGRGVLTGCHRWDLHNAITSGAYLATVAAMATSLALGGGLRSLAAAYLAGTVAGELVRVAAAFRVCPEVRVGLRYATWAQAREMLAFGGKAFVSMSARLLLLQSNALIIAHHLGPAALAVYSRPMALIRHAETFTAKMAMVLGPTASSLIASGRRAELRDLFLRGSSYGASLAFPLLLGLVVQGDLIMQVWMGPRYEPGLTLVILGIGYMFALTQASNFQILAGLNRHGPLAIAGLAAAVFGVGLSYALVGGVGLGLTGAALAVAVPLAFTTTFSAFHACRVLEVTPGTYLRRALLVPVACAVPFLACLLLGRLVFRGQLVPSLLAGPCLGGVALAALYWRFLLSSELRGKLLERARPMFRRLGFSQP